MANPNSILIIVEWPNKTVLPVSVSPLSYVEQLVSLLEHAVFPRQSIQLFNNGIKISPKHTIDEAGIINKSRIQALFEDKISISKSNRSQIDAEISRLKDLHYFRMDSENIYLSSDSSYSTDYHT